MQIVGVEAELSLFLIVETIQADILMGSRSGFVVEGIGHAAAVGNASPISFCEVLRITVNRHTAFEVFLAVLEDILGHFAQVEVEVAAVIARKVALVDERVHHPELDVFDVLCLEVGIVEFAHHAAPSLFRMLQVSVLVNICREVVGATFFGIEGKVQDVQTCCAGVVVL